jgi:hypothetical protein
MTMFTVHKISELEKPCSFVISDYFLVILDYVLVRLDGQ